MDMGPSEERGSREEPIDMPTDRKRTVDGDRASVASSTHSTHSRDSMDTTALEESHPLLQSEQPPAYSRNAAPSSIWLQASHAQYSSYGAIPTRSLSQPQEASFNPDPPSTPSDADTERQGPSSDAKDSPRRRCGPCWPCKLPRSCKEVIRMLVILLVLVAVAVLLGSSLFNQWKELNEQDMLPIPSCSNAIVHRAASFDFEQSSKFRFHEAINSEVFLPGRLDGKVLVKQGASHQKASIKVDIEMQSSYLTFLEHVRFEEHEDRLELRSKKPAHGGGIFEEDECTVINIIISIKPIPYMTDLSIDTDHLSTELSRSLRLTFNNLRIRSDIGSIANAQRDVLDTAASRVSVETGRGQIKGRFVLDNELTLRNHDGQIDVDVDTRAQKMPVDVHVPAILVASTASGHIDVKFADDYAGRDYRVEVKTVQGSIRGKYVHGSNTLLESVSGAIRATLIPYGDSDASNITTHNVFGPTDIEVLSAKHLSSSTNQMAHTRSHHESVSGSLKLRYPLQWQGTAKGSTLTGGLDAVGRGVEITEHTDHTIRLKKGDGTSNLYFGTLSGNVDLLVGG